MYILFDIGASKIRFARSDDLRSFDEPLVEKNPQDYMEAMVIIKGMVDKLSQGGEIEGIAGGVAGVVDPLTNNLVFSPNMKDWEGRPLVNDLKRIAGKTPTVFNDTQVSGLGEAVYGAGADYRVVAYITASTGIGGSITVDKEIKAHKYSFEPGHQIIDYKNGITLHSLIAGRELEEKYNKHPSTLDQKIWDEITKTLAIGLHNSIIHWSPEVIVIGGSLMHKISIEDLRSYLKKSLTMYPEAPEIVTSSLGDFNGIYGAMAYLRDR